MSEHSSSAECEAAELDLNAYVDGELLLAARAAIERHLETCADCRESVALLRLVTQALGQVPRPDPSEAMGLRLLAQVITEMPLHRMEIRCTERHGQEVVQSREVRWFREPAALPERPPEPWLGLVPIIVGGRAVPQRCRQAVRHSATIYQIIESYYGRDDHE